MKVNPPNNPLDPEPIEAPRSIPKPPRLLDRVRAAIRVRHYSIRTETAYIGWIRRFIFFHGVRHPDDMGAGVSSKRQEYNGTFIACHN